MQKKAAAKAKPKMMKPAETAPAAEWAAWENEQAVAKAVRAEKNAEEKATREPKKRAKPKMRPAADAPEAEWDAWKKECARLDKRRFNR